MQRVRGRRAPAWWAGGALLLAGCAPGAVPAGAPAPPEGPAPATAISYTEAQAERGREVFNTICSSCHALGEFRGQMFRVTWMARPVGDFFQHISTAMPEDRPGSLTPEQYAAVVAYVLQLNGHPAGGREVPSDARALAGVAWPR